MNKLLLEKLLASDFTFGFELEAKLNLYETPIDKDTPGWDEFIAYCEENINTLGFDYKRIKNYGDLQDALRDALDAGEIEEDDYDAWIDTLLPFSSVKPIAYKQFNFDDYFKSKTYVVAPSKGMTYDGSLGLGGFEWRSPVLKLTPDCIIECIGFLKDIKKIFFIDNECGFHTHIAFNGITPDDAMWLELKLAMDEDERNEVTELALYTDPAADEYEPIDYSNRYASSEYLEKLSFALYDKNYEKVASLLTNEKYRALRIHPQGTLEWRAPRGFLDEDNSNDYIKSFFLQLHQFVRWMINALDEKTIEGCDLDKDNLLEMIKSYANKDNLFKDKLTAGEDNLIKKLYRLDKKVLKNMDKIPSTKIDKAIVKIMRDKSMKFNFINDFMEHLRYEGDIPSNLFAKVYAFADPDERQHLIQSYNLEILPFDLMYKAHNKIFGSNDEQSTYSLFAGTILFMTDENILALLNCGHELPKNFITLSVIRPLVVHERFSNKIRNTIINNGLLSFNEYTVFMDSIKREKY